ncbi:hypothetical protein [Paenibacillus harenae]|uniref:Membrane protein DedA with SNARE-associated domain n=1 Tax=Paenibacillus harenae TaxID=306543 RepID=A0ABT9TZE2_PAEHA|nr:hypothetical protein [Paenibacillus harenae]MDQ0058478.1 membrane protein DedA with SNARE-associated domain [Paenibacillus harenae]MDQ0111820.1 membrane protein DedA with SNARE-associated domain [Paenibacillus harenae]
MEEQISMRDVYEIMTYLLVIVLSSVIMVAWLKRKAKKKKQG